MEINWNSDNVPNGSRQKLIGRSIGKVLGPVDMPMFRSIDLAIYPIRSRCNQIKVIFEGIPLGYRERSTRTVTSFRNTYNSIFTWNLKHQLVVLCCFEDVRLFFTTFKSWKQRITNLWNSNGETGTPFSTSQELNHSSHFQHRLV